MCMFVRMRLSVDVRATVGAEEADAAIRRQRDRDRDGDGDGGRDKDRGRGSDGDRDREAMRRSPCIGQSRHHKMMWPRPPDGYDGYGRGIIR